MTSKEEVNERTHLLSQNYTQNYTGPIEGVSHPHNTARIGIRDETDIRPVSSLSATESVASASSGSAAMGRDRQPPSSFMGLKSWLQDVSLPVYIFIMLFAISSWIDINGLWVEIPLLVNELPESWNLPSYIIVIIQLANVGPLIYTILVKVWPERIKEWPFVYIIIAVGALSCLALVFFWDSTSYINGEEHSTGLLSLTFFLSLVDCTSSVVYLPYMAMFKPQYMTAFYIGEGLSGLIPGLVGLAQGVGGDPACINRSTVYPNNDTGMNDTEWNLYPEYPPPNFSVEVFFFFLFCMIIVSGFSFTCIHFMPFAKRERMEPVGLYEITPSSDMTYMPSNSKSTDMAKSETETGVDNGKNEGNQDDIVYSKEIVDPTVPSTEPLANVESKQLDMKFTRTQFVFLLVITAWINALTNGVLPSTQSYSCLPYGNLAYTLTVRLSTVANPLACFLALFVPLPSLFVVGLLTLLGTVLSGYQLTLAALSPSPPLQGEPAGEFLVIITSVLLTALFSYTKVSIASLLRHDGGRNALIWCGGVTQVGSFVGAIVIFVLVNIQQVFESMPACPVV